MASSFFINRRMVGYLGQTIVGTIDISITAHFHSALNSFPVSWCLVYGRKLENL